MSSPTLDMNDWQEDLRTWLEPFLAALGRSEQRYWAPLYLQGLRMCQRESHGKVVLDAPKYLTKSFVPPCGARSVSNSCRLCGAPAVASVP